MDTHAVGRLQGCATFQRASSEAKVPGALPSSSRRPSDPSSVLRLVAKELSGLLAHPCQAMGYLHQCAAVAPTALVSLSQRRRAAWAYA